MNAKETLKVAREIRAFTREVRKGHKKALAKQVLIRAGIIDNQGRVKKMYR